MHDSHLLNSTRHGDIFFSPVDRVSIMCLVEHQERTLFMYMDGSTSTIEWSVAGLDLEAY